MLNSESVQDTMFTLDDVRHWKLPESRWLLVHERLERVAAAARAGDGSVLVKATVALELLSPIRGKRLGTEPTVPPPPSVEELVNETLDSLRTATRSTEEDDDRTAD